MLVARTRSMPSPRPLALAPVLAWSLACTGGPSPVTPKGGDESTSSSTEIPSDPEPTPDVPHPPTDDDSTTASDPPPPDLGSDLPPAEPPPIHQRFVDVT